MRDGHAAPHPEGSSGPPGIDQPDLRGMFPEPLAEELGVGGRRPHHERGSEAGAERGPGLRDPAFRSRHLGRVARQEVIHRGRRRQARDRRQHAESVGGEHHDLTRMPAPPGRHVRIDGRERIRPPRILGDRVIIEIQSAGHRIDGHVFEHGAEPLRRGVNLRLRLGREPDHLRVAAALEVEYAAVAPPVLVVPDETPGGIARQRRLAGPGQPEEDGHVTAGTDVRRAVHRQHAPQRQQIVHHREHRLLDLAGIAGPPDQHQALREIQQDEHLGVRPVYPRIGLAGRRVDHGELGDVVRKLGTVGFGDEQVTGEQRVPSLLGHHPHRQAVGGVRPRVAVLHEQIPAAQMFDDGLVDGVEPVGIDRTVDVTPRDPGRARRLVHEESIAGRPPRVGAGAKDERPGRGHRSLPARHHFLVERSRRQIPEYRCRVDDSDSLQPLVRTHVQHPPCLSTATRRPQPRSAPADRAHRRPAAAPCRPTRPSNRTGHFLRSRCMARRGGRVKESTVQEGPTGVRNPLFRAIARNAGRGPSRPDAAILLSVSTWRQCGARTAPPIHPRSGRTAAAALTLGTGFPRVRTHAPDCI